MGWALVKNGEFAGELEVRLSRILTTEYNHMPYINIRTWWKNAFKPSLVQQWSRLENCPEISVEQVNNGTFVTQITQKFNTNLCEFDGKFDFQIHHQTHSQKIELSQYKQ